MNTKIMYRNNDNIYEAVSQLEQLIETPMHIDSSRPEYDAILSIGNQQFIIESKSMVRNSNQGVSLAQLDKLRQNNNRPIILIAEYISKNSAFELKQRGFNYIDIAGNAFIKSGNLFIHVEGRKRKIKERTNQSRAFQEAGIKIIFHLLSKPENLQHSYRTISQLADVSIGSVSNVMAELVDLNYLIKTDDRRVLKNKNDLLDRWLMAYNSVLRPRIVRKRMKFVDADYLKYWRDKDLIKYRGEVVWGGEPGGAILTNNLRPENFTIFTDFDLSTLATLLRLVPDPNGNVEILQMFWKDKDESTYVAPALLIYADLMNSGYGRNVETANQILEDELQHIK
jgi:hypothetical protein